MQIAADTEVGITTEGNTVSWSDISGAVRDVREYLGLKLTTGGCATRFLYELAGHKCRMPQSFGGKPLLVHVHAVMDQIGEMERAQISQALKTKAASGFSASTARFETLASSAWVFLRASDAVRSLFCKATHCSPGLSAHAIRSPTESVCRNQSFH